MGFARAVTTCLSKFGDFSGRAQRSEFWWFVLFHMLAVTALAAVDVSRIRGLSPEAVAGLDMFWFASTWGSFVLFLPYWAVGVRRLHDTDRSGFWMLGYLIPLVGIYVLILHVLPSDTGRNRFGTLDGQARRRPVVPDPMTASAREEAHADIRALRMSRMQGNEA